MILIGSRALKLRAPVLVEHEPRDFDFIGNEFEIKKFIEKFKLEITETLPNKIICQGNIIAEFEILEKSPSDILLQKILNEDNETINSRLGQIPNLNILFALKSSHRFLKDSPFFWKTAIDYHKMKLFGAEIPDNLKEFHKIREEETYAAQKHPKLNVNKNEFFKDDGVKYKYDHDDIHKAIALKENPAYLSYLKEGSQVLSDKNKFFEVREEIRLNGVIEEACVLAIERSLVPFPGAKTPKEAWLFALSKVCSSITSGFFREYAYQNIFEVIKLYPQNYFEIFQSAVAKGKVRNFEN